MSDLVSQIKESLDIVTALQKYTSANFSKRRGIKGKICCPFHSEKSPSFQVDTEKNTWRCFGACAEKGDVIILYSKVFGVDNKTAIKQLGKELGLIQGNSELSQEKKAEINKEYKEKEAIREIKENIEKSYSNLCSIYVRMKSLIKATNTIEELENISVIVDMEKYIEYLLDCLQEKNGKEDYLSAYVSSKGVIKKWNLILKI